MTIKTFLRKFQSNASIQDIAGIVLDVKNYKNFVPHVSASNVIHQDENKIIAELIISFLSFKVPYTSKITFDINSKEAIINVSEHGSNTFKKLYNKWKITKNEQEIIIDFEVEFELKNKMLGLLASASINLVADVILESFIKKAKQIL